MQPYKQIIPPLALSLAFGAIAYAFVVHQWADKDALYTAATVATFFVIAWYTIETQRLRAVAQTQLTETQRQASTAKQQIGIALQQFGESQKQFQLAQKQLTEIQRQTEHNNRPIIALGFSPFPLGSGNGTVSYLSIHNVGTGPAFNIAISPLGIYNQQQLTISHPHFVGPQQLEKAQIIFHNVLDGKETEASRESLLHNILKHSVKEALIDIEISYNGPDGTRYKTSCALSYPPSPQWFAFVSYERIPPLP